jgi:hypothetical protein
MSCQPEHAESSSDDEKKIMQRDWKKNLSAIEKVITLIMTDCERFGFIITYRLFVGGVQGRSYG